MECFTEIQKAREEVEAKLVAWNVAEPEFEQAAWFAYLSAYERLNALIVDAKQREARQVLLQADFTAAS